MLRNRHERTTSLANLLDRPRKKGDTSEGKTDSTNKDDSPKEEKKPSRFLGIIQKKKENDQDIPAKESKGEEEVKKKKKNDKEAESKGRFFGQRKNKTDEDNKNMVDEKKPERKGIGRTLRSTKVYNKLHDLKDSRKQTNVRQGDHRLHEACSQGNIERCKWLIEEKGCDVNEQYKHHTPLQSAIQKEHIDMVKLLISEYRASIPDGFNGGAFISACEVGNKSIVKFLAQTRPESANTDFGIFRRGSLHAASEKNHADVVLYLIKRCSVDVNAVDAYGSTSLHKACALGHTDVVQCLLEKGKADPSIKTFKTGETALHRAVVFGHTDAAKAVVDECPELVHERNSEGKTPLDLARCPGRQTLLSLLEEAASSVPAPEVDEPSASEETTFNKLTPAPHNPPSTESPVSSKSSRFRTAEEENDDTISQEKVQSIVTKVDEEDFEAKTTMVLARSGLPQRVRDIESKLKLSSASNDDLMDRMERVEADLEFHRLNYERLPDKLDERLKALESENKLLWDRLLYMETEMMEQRNQGAGFMKV